jgi:hypothetical protein
VPLEDGPVAPRVPLRDRLSCQGSVQLRAESLGAFLGAWAEKNSARNLTNRDDVSGAQPTNRHLTRCQYHQAH